MVNNRIDLRKSQCSYWLFFCVRDSSENPFMECNEIKDCNE